MTDLVVRGAGIFGLSIAWTALNRGASVVVVDPHGPGAGSSGGVVGALQPHTPDPWNAKKQFQFESLCLAKEFWPGVDDISGQNSGYARVGRLMPLRTERDVILAKERETAAAQNWADTASWTVTTLPGDWAIPSPTGHFVHDTLSAILNPYRAVASLVGAIQAKGGRIVAESDFEGATIWATGWHGLNDLSAILQRPVGNGVKGQAILLDHDARGQPQVFADGLHFIPHVDGTLAIGSTSERAFTSGTQTDEQLDALLDRARTVIPALGQARILRRWASVRPRSNSRAPLLGPWPDRAGHFVANGGFKIGFGMAPKVAEVMVDLVLDGRDTIPPEFHTNLL